VTNELAKLTVYINRMRIVFVVFSALAASSFAVSLGCCVAMLLGDHSALQPVLIDDDVFLPEGLLPNLQQNASIAGRCLLILAVSAWLFWLSTSSHFARKAGAKDMHYSRIMAVVWNFVPVLHYGMPLLVLVELAAATKTPDDWKTVRPSRLAGVTWLVSKASAIVLAIGSKLLEGVETADQYVQSMEIVSVSLILVITGLLLANLFMRQMLQWQRALASAA